MPRRALRDMFRLFRGCNLKFLSLICMKMLTSTLACFTANDTATSVSAAEKIKVATGTLSQMGGFYGQRQELNRSLFVTLSETAVSDTGLG